MPLELTGIANVNEFYSHYYLDALLESDVKGLLARWAERERETGDAPPQKRLLRCASEFFRDKSQAGQTISGDRRYEIAHSTNVRLAEALGYQAQSGQYEVLEDDFALPLLAAYQRDGQAHLWIAEGGWPNVDAAVLESNLAQSQRPEVLEEGLRMPWDETWESLISLIFRRPEPPRFVLLMCGRLVFLAERHKWGQGKHLVFDFDELLDRKQPDALRAAAVLISRDSLCPESGIVLHDTLDENSHKHAYAVSEDLKYGLRRAVELLANEYIWYQSHRNKQQIFQDNELAAKLTEECLRYLYRLLFLFYAEARGAQLGVVPMESDEYRLGYSLEALRDLELVPLTAPAVQEGYFFDHSLRRLFEIVNQGVKGNSRQMEFASIVGTVPPKDVPADAWLNYGFTLQGLESPLFERNRTPLLSSVRFRNFVLQEVIRLLFLSREDDRRSRKQGRGRISYAELGINQLGAVYEGILSYKGFYAAEPLYEVRSADGAKADVTGQSWFVKESDAHLYHEAEFVYDTIEGSENGEKRRRKFAKGTFIFRLAGRDREKSASYYTPSCLTECVVKYSLKGLLEGKTADDILRLTICEPAMGSAAFLNEAINQLSREYLERKQREVGRQISPSAFEEECQKVKAYLATHNCFGVDLNSVASELARVSLWLNTIYRGCRTPWFGLRLAVGNSLIGARREVVRAHDLENCAWMEKVPERVPIGPVWQERPIRSVYHFLLPDKSMGALDSDKVVRSLAPEETRAIRELRHDFCRAMEPDEIDKLLELSDAVDELWRQVIQERRNAVNRTDQRIAVWGHQIAADDSQLIARHEKEAADLERPFTAYRRLKLVMDYWCALWFWPLAQVKQLPSRDTFLLDLELILRGMVQYRGSAGLPSLGTDLSPEHQAFLSHFGLVDVDELCEKVERLQIVAEVAGRHRFHHWELRFAEVFAEAGGFDLIIGNPPWVKLEWNESGLMGELDPTLAIRGDSATDIGDKRNSLLKSSSSLDAYLSEFAEATGGKTFLNTYANYPLLKGIQSNLYKCVAFRARPNDNQ